MKSFFTMLTTVAFCASPAAFGAGQTAEQIYKSTYINVMQGTDSAQALQSLMTQAKANGLSVKDVLEAAVQKGWMTQDQLNTVLDVAAKTDKATAEKVAKGQMSDKELAALTDAIQGKVNGAAYGYGWCRYGCYSRPGFYVGGFFLVLLVVALCLTPVYY